MRKTWIILGCLCLLLAVLVGLTAANGVLILPPAPSPASPGATAEPTPAPAATPAPTPAPQPITLPGGTELWPEQSELRLADPDAETLAALCAAAPELSALKTLALEGAALAPEQLLALRQAFPEAAITAALRLFGQELPADAQSLTLADPAALAADEAWLSRLDILLPGLRALSVPNEEGAFSLAALGALREALPEAIALDCRFELFGQWLSSADEEIVYEKAGLREGDLDTVRRALPLLAGCRRFVLDNCGPSYEQLAALRDEFPDKNIVWRVHLNQDSLLTDATVLWSIYVRDENCDALKYCTELEYIDLGHDEWLSNIDFTAYMPKLKVLIIALTGVTDISPLANCPELEYLEIFRTDISDLSPLVHCQKLEHLNISSMLYVTDISPLYELKNLKRLWTVFSSRIPQEQKDEIRRRLPDCEFRFIGDDCTANGWRTGPDGLPVPRYALLKEQMGYNGYNSPADKIDWDKAWKPGYA